MFGLFDSAVCAILSAGWDSGTAPHRPDVIPETGSGRVLQTNPPGLPNLIDLVEQHQAIALQPRLISHMLATRHRLVPAAPVPLTPEGREPPLGPYRLKRDRPRESPQDPRSRSPAPLTSPSSTSSADASFTFTRASGTTPTSHDDRRQRRGGGIRRGPRHPTKCPDITETGHRPVPRHALGVPCLLRPG